MKVFITPEENKMLLNEELFGVPQEVFMDEDEEKKCLEEFNEESDPGPNWEVEREMGERFAYSESSCYFPKANERDTCLARTMTLAEINDVTGLFLEENRGMIGIDECDWDSLGKKKDYHKPRRKKGKHKLTISHTKYKFNKRVILGLL
jgi:hypothetical protein